MTCKVALTGAGISAPSGLPVYRRDGETSWSDERAEKMMNLRTYRNHLPHLWRWSLDIRDQATSVGPNAAHLALADAGVHVLTQNVDGLHQAAGSDDVVELHGSIRRGRCRKNHTFEITDALAQQAREGIEGVPACPQCSYWLTRPDVVLFGEMLLRRTLDRAEKLLRSADVLYVVGTSGIVHPAADFPDEVRRHGGRTVLVSAHPWVGDHEFDEVHLGDAAVILPQLLAS